jgi:hypothetical protein
MITSFAEFLEKLQAKEVAILSDEQVNHGPTIGDMYEGLTRELLERAIPEALNLKLVDGFVVGTDGSYSNQTDAMLVMGDSGHKIPKTEKWAWPIEDVLAVFEVKKNLYAAELADSISKMSRVSELQMKLLRSSKSHPNLGPSLQAFAKTLGRSPFPDELDNLESQGGEILRIIAHEQLAPVRVVFGYEGYVDEPGLRAAFLDAIEAIRGGVAGPGLLPNLIICRKNAIIKLTGHPYLVPIRDSGEWDLFGSTSKAPFELLLELIWTRLANQFRAQFPVDDSLSVEAIAPLLTGKFIVQGQQRGWMYYAKSLAIKQLAERENSEWSPLALSTEESALLQLFVLEGSLDLDNEKLVEAAEEAEVNLEAFAAKLVDARLFSWVSSRVARPICDTIRTVVTPDGQFWASDNSDLLSLWLSERA